TASRRSRARPRGSSVCSATTATARKGTGRSTLTTVLGGVLVVVLIALFVGQMVVRRRRRAPSRP
ncbi:MAG: hypothetical protein ABI317_11415, partial [Gaiellales bacterium]